MARVAFSVGGGCALAAAQTRVACGKTTHLHWRVGPDIEPFPLVLDLGLYKFDCLAHGELRWDGARRQARGE